MRKITFVLAFVLIATVAFSQQGKKKTKEDTKGGKGKATSEQRAQRSVDNLDKSVTLTADQKTKIYDLALARAKKHETGKSADKAARKEEFKAANKEYRAAVKATLTPEQINKLKEKKKEKDKVKKDKKDPKAAKGSNEELEGSEEAEDIVTEE